MSTGVRIVLGLEVDPLHCVTQAGSFSSQAEKWVTSHLEWVGEYMRGPWALWPGTSVSVPRSGYRCTLGLVPFPLQSLVLHNYGLQAGWGGA